MNDEPSNPLAFPMLGSSRERGNEVDLDIMQEGMELRDYFAAHAPNPLDDFVNWDDCTHKLPKPEDYKTEPKGLEGEAYRPEYNAANRDIAPLRTTCARYAYAVANHVARNATKS